MACGRLDLLVRRRGEERPPPTGAPSVIDDLARRRSPPRGRESVGGVALVDVLFALSLVAVIGACALPILDHARERGRSEAAARFVLAMFRTAQFEAVRRGTSVGVRARLTGSGVPLRLHADGNGDGVRLDDITTGVDQPLSPERWVERDFPGVVIAILRPLPDIDGSGTLSPGSDAVRLGSSDIASFSPEGTASGGTIYLEGRDQTPYAIRILAATGRTRLLRFNLASNAWESR